MNVDNLIIAPSLDLGNTFYLFRDNGVEITIKVNRNEILTDKVLHPDEKKKLETMFLRTGLRVA